MNASTWLIVAIVAFSLSGVAAVVAAIMFFSMNIPAVIGDLTGKTVAREIRAIRAERASDQPRKTRVDRDSRRDLSRTGGLYPVRVSAGASRRLDRTSGRSGALAQTPTVESTTVLEENQVPSANETTVLEENQTAAPEENFTTVLEETPVDLTNEQLTTVLWNESGSSVTFGDENVTTVLRGNTAELADVEPMRFEIVRSVMLIQSAEIIR